MGGCICLMTFTLIGSELTPYGVYSSPEKLQHFVFIIPLSNYVFFYLLISWANSFFSVDLQTVLLYVEFVLLA